MNRIEKIACKIAAEIPEWASPEFMTNLNLNISGTPLKRFGARIQGIQTWMLKAEGKLYKDRFGWVSVTWTVHPMIEGQDWKVRSEMSFAPASSGSFANEKFGEFKQVVSISGQKGFGLFGIESRVIEVRPEGNAVREVNELIEQHGKDLVEAKRYWKKQLVLFKQQYGGLA